MATEGAQGPRRSGWGAQLGDMVLDSHPASVSHLWACNRQAPSLLWASVASRNNERSSHSVSEDMGLLDLDFLPVWLT